MKIIEFNCNEERFYHLLKVLRNNLSYDTFLEIYRQANKADDYQFTGMEVDGKLVALMGHRILHDYVHGRHLYIDDLVTDPTVRSRGIGAKMLTIAEGIAKDKGCNNLRLCTGLENEAAKKFYEKNGWNFRAVVFKKKL